MAYLERDRDINAQNGGQNAHGDLHLTRWNGPRRCAFATGLTGTRRVARGMALPTQTEAGSIRLATSPTGAHGWTTGPDWSAHRRSDRPSYTGTRRSCPHLSDHIHIRVTLC